MPKRELMTPKKMVTGLRRPKAVAGPVDPPVRRRILGKNKEVNMEDDITGLDRLAEDCGPLGFWQPTHRHGALSAIREWLDPRQFVARWRDRRLAAHRPVYWLGRAAEQGFVYQLHSPAGRTSTVVPDLLEGRE